MWKWFVTLIFPLRITHPLHGFQQKLHCDRSFEVKYTTVMLHMGRHVIPTFLVVPHYLEKTSRKERKKRWKLWDPASLQRQTHVQMYIFFLKTRSLNKSHVSCTPPCPRKPFPSPIKCHEVISEVPRCAWSDFTGILISCYQACLEDRGTRVASPLRACTKMSVGFTFSDSVDFI